MGENKIDFSHQNFPQYKEKYIISKKIFQMHNNKLITILKHFSKTDLNQFYKYIISPYFNKSKQLIQFYEIILKGINSPKVALLEKQNVWNKLFKDQKYNDVRFRKLSSDLLKLIEGFLAQQIYDSNNLQKAANLIESVGIKGIEKFYSSVIRIANNESEKYPFEDADFYLKQYQIQKNYYEIIQHEFQHSKRQNLEEIDKNLDNFYLAEKLRYLCAALSQKQRGSHEYLLSHENEIVDLIKKRNKTLTPAEAIYQQIYLTYIEGENEKHFYKLRDLLKIHGLKFHSIEGKTLYDSAINYCVKKLNQGKTEFLEQLFEMYEDYLKKELIYIDGELDPFHFKNIVIAGLRLGKFNWIEEFINESREKIPESSRENAYTFNLARLFWYKKEHDKVISLLQEVEYEDIVYNLSAKAMLLTTYYETGETEPLYSLFESFRAYLSRRKDIPERWKKGYMNLIKFTKKLTRIIKGDDKAINRIKIEIKESNNIADVKWLNEKIAELEK